MKQELDRVEGLGYKKKKITRCKKCAELNSKRKKYIEDFRSTHKSEDYWKMDLSKMSGHCEEHQYLIKPGIHSDRPKGLKRRFGSGITRKRWKQRKLKGTKFLV